MGVWIETMEGTRAFEQLQVTPYVGVWIETNLLSISVTDRSVTPYVGVWIETKTLKPIFIVHPRHSLCGSVD